MIYIVTEKDEMVLATKDKKKADNYISKKPAAELLSFNDDAVAHESLDLHLGRGIMVPVSKVLEALGKK